VRESAARSPFNYAAAVMPLTLDVIAQTASPPDHDGVRQDPLWAHRFADDRFDTFPEALYDGLDAALRAVAKQRPRSFRRYERPLRDHLTYDSARFILFRAWAANPKTFWPGAIEVLIELPTAMRTGYISSPYWVTRELVASIQSYASDERLSALEERIRGYYSNWEQSAEGRRQHGRAQYTLLSAFDEERLSPQGVRRLQELRRKFGDDIERPRGVVGGFVGPPIPEAAAARMTDDQWLTATSRYADETSHRLDDFLRGGAIELSRVLEGETKKDPSRFAVLAARFPLGTNEAYFDAILRGLGDAEHGVAPDDVFRVIRRIFDEPGRPSGRWFVRPLARVADGPVPQDVLSIVGWYATDHPDPARDTWRASAEGEVHYGGDPVTAGINSVRGSAAQALSALIWPDGERVAELRSTLDRLVEDSVLSVRVCAAYAISAVYQHDPDHALRLFRRLTAAPDELLATDPVERLISVLAASRFPDLREVLQRMLESREPGVREAGGRQAALALLSTDDASDLAERAIEGTERERLGVAQVAATNIANVDVRTRCVEWLSALAHDRDGDVRKEVSRWPSVVDADELRELAEFTRTYVETEAHLNNQYPLLHALDETRAPVADVVLRAVERFLEEHGSDMGDITRASAMYAPIAAKLVTRAYASSTSDEMRERCLDVIDRLLAAREHGVAAMVATYG
jgi:hypothetical protein